MVPVWRRCEDVAVVDSGDRVVVLNLAESAGGVPRALEGSGSAIWRLVDGVRSERDLIGELAEAYRVGAESISRDVHDFLVQLENEGLITPTAPAPGGVR